MGGAVQDTGLQAGGLLKGKVMERKREEESASLGLGLRLRSRALVLGLRLRFGDVPRIARDGGILPATLLTEESDFWSALGVRFTS